MTETHEPKRFGFVALIGRPNVGKSTLMNALVGEKLAIVSEKPQTTRNRVTGIKTIDSDQIVFLDTPGICRQRSRVERFMLGETSASMDGIDATVLVTDAYSTVRNRGKTSPTPLHVDLAALEFVKKHASDQPRIIVLNMVDRLPNREPLLPLLAAWQALGEEILVPTSATRGTGVDALLGEVRELLRPGEHHYDEDALTDRAERFLVGELIREQVYQQCRQEIPYATAVEVLEMQERFPRSAVMIHAVVYVEREGQKGIVIGAGARRIKSIGIVAREEIEKLLGCTAHLKLTVEVETNWSDRPDALQRFGYG